MNGTIDSILAQTYKNIEVILVNDGSTDGSGEICNTYASLDRRIKVHHLPGNGHGVSYSRNIGLQVATGELIGFSDHDDYMYPDMIETCVNNMKDYDLITTGFFTVSEKVFNKNTLRKTNTTPTFVAKNIEEMSGENYHGVERWICTIWRCLFRTNIIKENNIKFRPINSEDDHFLLDYLLVINSIIRLDDFYGYCWIDRANSLGSSHKYIEEYEGLQHREESHDKLYARYSCTTPSWPISDLCQRWCHYILKGYYIDTGVERSERIKRWKLFRNNKYQKMVKLRPWRTRNKHGIIYQTMVFITRTRMFYILDPIIKYTTRCFV